MGGASHEWSKRLLHIRRMEKNEKVVNGESGLALEKGAEQPNLGIVVLTNSSVIFQAGN